MERQQMILDFTVAKDWSDTRNVPILLGEFGVIRKAHRPSMVKWYELLTKTADEFGFAQTTWCNGDKEGYATYFRNHEYWDHELLNIQTRQFPYSGSIIKAPGIIEAEDFDLGGQQVAYNTSDSVNTLGYYRPDEGVEIDSVGDSNYAILITRQGEWIEYSFSVDTASLFEVVMDVSTLEEGKTIKAKFNGAIHTASLAVPQGSSKNEFNSIKDTVYLETGTQVVRLFGESSGVYVDKIALIKVNVEGDTNNLLINPDFELGIVGWSGHSAAIEIVEDPVQSGSAAVLASERQANWASVKQDITAVLQEHGPGYYTSSAYMKAPADTGFTGKVTVQITVSGEESYLGAGDTIPPGEWKQIVNNLLINWEGTLQNAVFYIETVSPYTGDFYCDNASLSIDSLLGPPAVGILNKALLPMAGLSQNYPNPFHQHTSIQFTISKPGLYQLVVFDIQGQAMKRIVDEELQAGTYNVKFNTEALPPGIYFYRLTGREVNLTRKMMLLK